jgi:tetratricopeptide (TPR) repeat protein
MNTPSQGMTIERALSQAHSHWQAGQADQAELLCQQVLAQWPGQSDALHLMGLMAHAYGNLDLAIDHLRNACLAPRAPAIYVSNLAEMLRQAGRLVDAEHAARRSVAMDNALVAGWNNLGIILQECGKLDESLSCLERVVALQPGYAEAHNNLGNTLKRLGRLDKARAHYEQALTIAPQYAEALSNLSFLLNDLGQMDDALDFARRAIDANPRLSDAYINAAAVEVARQRFAEALRWIDALLSYAPVHVGALTVRSTILRRMGRLEDALIDARRAVAAAPENGEAQNILGEALQAQDKMDEAMVAFDRASQSMGVGTEKALLNRGIVFMERGDRDAAKTAFEDVLKRYAHSTTAWFNLADLQRFKAGDPAISAMEALLTSGRVQVQSDRTALHFALGKAWMDVGDAERAFAHMDEGNRQKRATFSYDAAGISSWFSEIIASFPAEAIQRPKTKIPGDDLAVFVLGMPRSGTTLVEQILASHPAIHGAGELATVQDQIHHSGGLGTIVENLTPESEARLGQCYLDAIKPLAGIKRRVVDKMPSNFLYVGLIHRMLPNARIIHVRRDPVDTCLSCYTKLFTREQLFSYDQAELASFYADYLRLMDHWRAILPTDRFIEVNYEDVVADVETQARRLVAFCDLDWSPACLDFYLTQRTIRTASINQVRQPIYNHSVGRWHSFARYLGPLLAGLGIDQAPTKDAAAVDGQTPIRRDKKPVAKA